MTKRRAGMPTIDSPEIGAGLAEAGADVVESDASLQGVHIAGGEIPGRALAQLEISKCVFSGLTLTGATLADIDLVDVVFRQCELSGCALERARLNRVLFHGCRMTAVACPEVKASNTAFEECTMSEAWFRMSSLDRVRFEDCRLEGADFYGAAIRRSRFVRSDLSHAELSDTMCEEVALHGSTLAGIKGARRLRNLVIATDQIYDLALPVFSALQIVVDDEYFADRE